MSRRKKRRNDREVGNWMQIAGQAFIRGLGHAFGLPETGESSISRAAVTKVQSWVTVLRKSATCLQVLVCPDLLGEVLDTVPGAPLVVSKPWPSSQNHLRHRYGTEIHEESYWHSSVLWNCSPNENGMNEFSKSLWLDKMSPAEVRVHERLLIYWLTEWINLWAPIPCRRL